MTIIVKIHIWPDETAIAYNTKLKTLMQIFAYEIVGHANNFYAFINNFLSLQPYTLLKSTQ